MSDPIDVVVGLVALNGGQLVSKTRLQKTFYLLEQFGLGTGFEFDYYHFGPFSAELAGATDDAADMGRLTTEVRPGFHEEPYTVYQSENGPPDRLSRLAAAEVREKLDVLGRYSALELEVAATILYLRENGYGDNARAETMARKPLKATEERVERASQLIQDLGVGIT